jgi:hypothetical protein
MQEIKSKLTNKQTNKQANRQASKQTNKQTNNPSTVFNKSTNNKCTTSIKQTTMCFLVLNLVDNFCFGIIHIIAAIKQAHKTQYFIYFRVWRSLSSVSLGY